MDGIVGVGAQHGGFQLGRHAVVDGIQAFRPVQGEGGDAAIDRVVDGGFGHGKRSGVFCWSGLGASR
ncbi:hypothetical protein D3C84_884080 [compost metagenome]